MDIIGISGLKGSGKSTLAKQLVPSTTLPIAWAIKEALLAMGISRKFLYDPEYKERPSRLLQGKTGRFAMVTLGTEWGRNMMGEDFWLDLWIEKVLTLKGTIVVDDVRFPNEVEAIRNLGGFVVAVRKPDQQAKKFWQRWHQSESLRPERYGIPVIMNDGTPEQLLERFRALDTSNRS